MKKIIFFLIFFVIVVRVEKGFAKDAPIVNSIEKHLLTELLFDKDSIAFVDTTLISNKDSLLTYVVNTGNCGVNCSLRGKKAIIQQGYVGNAVHFIDSAYIFAGKDESSLNLEKFTTMAWIKPLSYGLDSKRIEIVERTNVFWMNIRSDTRIFRAGIFDKDDKWYFIDSDCIIPLNEWIHTAFTYDGDSLKIYINGRLSGSYSAGNRGLSSAQNRTLSIGSRQPLTNEPPAAFFDGLIDEFRLFDTILVQEEIIDYMNINNPLAVAPSSPTMLKVDSLNVGKVALSWNDNSNNENTFVIYCSTNNIDWSPIGNTPENETSFFCTGLEQKQEYFFKVVASGITGFSESSNKVSAVLPNQLAPAPVAYYKFENDFADSYGSLHGYGLYQTNFENNLPARDFDDPLFVEGVSGNAIDLTNVNAYISIPYTIHDSFSIAFWLKTKTKGNKSTQWFGGSGLIDAGITGFADDFGISLLNDKIAFGTGSNNVTILSDNSLVDNEWHEIVATFSADNLVMKTYVDGILQSEIGSALNRNSRGASGRIFIGKSRIDDEFYNGLIDEVRLFNVELNAEQIAQWHESQQNNSTSLFDVNLKLYPNPAHDYLHINTQIEEGFEIQLLNSNGATILTEKIKNSDRCTLNLAAIRSGVYFVKITSQNIVATKKIIIQ